MPFIDSTVTYGSISLQIVRTLECRREPVYSDDGIDFLYDKWTIEVDAASAQPSPSRPAPAPRAAAAAAGQGVASSPRPTGSEPASSRQSVTPGVKTNINSDRQPAHMSSVADHRQASDGLILVEFAHESRCLNAENCIRLIGACFAG